MGSDIAIRAENIGKMYRIGHRQRYKALRDSIVDVARAPFRILRDTFRPSELRGEDSLEDFWALRDVSFEIKKGEAVGLIGRNGAGKSTLLKILSKITEPTTGRIELNGRVGSLLEVGTGFHPELTGRENVFLNGAILGMKRWEINHKFDEIVEFAEIEKFLDTPVKHYSSGMYVRLAFAVAAHLEPEVLLVDEVLAVGDAQFQKKCLDRMGAIGGRGTTVVFVSHDMSAISRVCERALLVSSGSIELDAPPNRCIDQYLNVGYSAATDVITVSHPGRPPNAPKITSRLTLCDSALKPLATSQIDNQGSLTLRIEFDASEYAADFYQVGINDNMDRRLLTVTTEEIRRHPRGVLACHFPKLSLVEGTYSIVTLVGNRHPFAHIEYIERAIAFSIAPNDSEELYFKGQGFIQQECSWELIDTHEENQ